MSAPWSKLKARVEALWDPALPMAIHCTAYANNRARRGESRLSRHWLMLGKEMIWNFPGDFMGEGARGRSVPDCDPHFANGGSYVSVLLREYLDRPIAALFEPFEEDGWELTDVLRAADRRLGRAALLDWAKTLDPEHPAQRVLRARFGREAACACGRVQVICRGEPLKVSLCHCRECQRRSGGPFGIAAFFPREAVTASGETREFRRPSDSGSDVIFRFCPTCGSTVWWEGLRFPDRIAVASGAFADPDFPAPSQAVYREHRHAWLPEDLV